jgi:transcriptional/translational regulatory protein YebC/TACO1
MFAIKSGYPELKAANMPKENVERAIKKATDKDTADYKAVLFEGYAPHGIAL